MNDPIRAFRFVRSLLILGAVTTGLASAAQIAVPHVFVPGTPASAGEVNANFNAVRDGVNANDTAITNLETEVDALADEVEVQAARVGAPGLQIAGTVVGTVIDFDIYFGTVTAISDTGFIFSVEGGESDSPFVEGALLSLTFYYTANACAGTPYTAQTTASQAAIPEDPNPNPSIFYYRTGVVVGSPTPGGQAFMIQGTPAPVQIRSYQNPGETCVTIAPETHPAIALQPNNATVTGVSSTLAGPIAIIQR